MDTAQCGELAAGTSAAGTGSDWRSQLQPEARCRIVNKIMETLKNHVPVPSPEGLIELQNIAERFEERTYAAATSQSDYLRKISLKMLTMETQDKHTRKSLKLSSDPESKALLPRVETLKKHLPVSVPEGLTELQKIATKFEERIYAAGIIQSDYLRKISLKMLSVGSQNKTNTQEIPQNGQMVQNQRPRYLASNGSTSRVGYPGAGDLKEELYQMNETLKDQYLAGLRDLYEISTKLQGDNHVPTQRPKRIHEQVHFKLVLERSLQSLQIKKRPSLDESIPMYKREILSILNSEEWMPEQTFQQSAGQAPSTSSSGVWVTHGMLSPESRSIKRLRPSLQNDTRS